jgi:hypothetical protein
MQVTAVLAHVEAVISPDHHHRDIGAIMRNELRDRQQPFALAMD